MITDKQRAILENSIAIVPTHPKGNGKKRIPIYQNTLIGKSDNENDSGGSGEAEGSE